VTGRFALLLTVAGAAFAATAILECTFSELRAPALHLFTFRTSVTEGWVVEKSTLFLHVRQGVIPKTVEIGTLAAASGLRTPTPGPVRRIDVHSEREGWLRVTIPTETTQQLIDDPRRLLLVLPPRGVLFDGQGTALRSPYLVVEGKPPVRRASK
jgi:hypothetical protein